MIQVIITLIIISLLLFIISFFMEDKFKSLENQLEQFTISSMQETYQMKKKIRILEEELLANESLEQMVMNNKNSQTPIMNKISKLYNQGYSINEIAKETGLSEYDIRSIVQQYQPTKADEKL